MNDTSLQILSTNKSISTQVAKFCRLTSRFCKILSIKTLFKFSKPLESGLKLVKFYCTEMDLSTLITEDGQTLGKFPADQRKVQQSM